jgi:hypothetical protein
VVVVPLPVVVVVPPPLEVFLTGVPELLLELA